MPRREIDSTVADLRIAVPRARARGLGPRMLAGVAIVLAANAVFGERGVMETVRARQAYAAGAADVGRLRQESAALRDEMQRLREDPDTIEAVARGDLGLIRRGEIVITVRDLRR